MRIIQRNLIWLTASQIATWTSALVLVVIVPRHLSAGDFGELQFAAAFVGYFMLIGMLGTNTYIVKTVARDESTLGPLMVNGLVMKVALTAVLSVVAIALAHVLDYSDQMILLIEVSSAAMLLHVLNDTLGAGLQALQQMNRFAVWRVLSSYVGVALGLAVLFGDKGVVAYAIVVGLAALIPLVANTIQLWPKLRPSLRIDFSVWTRLARGGAPFLLWSAIILLYGTIDLPILKAMAGDAVVGAYALAFLWTSMPGSFSNIVAAATMPSLSANAVKESNTEFIRLTNRAVCLVLVVALPTSLGIALVARDMFEVLHYQAGFDKALPLIQILAVGMPIIGMTMVLGTALIALDRQKRWMMIGVGACLLNPLLNLAAIPITVRVFDNGAIGAAVITVATEVFMLVGALALRPRGIMDRATVSYACRCALAAAAMIPAILAVSGTALPVKVAVGVLAYGLASLALGTVSLDGFRVGADGRYAPARFLKTVTVPSE
jgi:PST family polysaccharide transporter